MKSYRAKKGNVKIIYCATAKEVKEIRLRFPANIPNKNVRKV